MYQQDPRFSENLEQYGKDCSEFASQAIHVYCQKSKAFLKSYYPHIKTPAYAGFFIALKLAVDFGNNAGTYSSAALTDSETQASSIAIGVISSTSISTLSPGIHISTPSGRVITPVTSVVLK